MTKLTSMAVVSHSISLMAMEEASRRGRRTADIDDMLLALTLDGSTAGQVLRSLGVTLSVARDAVAAQHSEQLAGVGVTAEPAAPNRITFHETAATYEWSARSLAIIGRAGEQGRSGDAVAILRGLIDEPSGLIASVLGRIGIAAADVHARLDESACIPDHGSTEASDPNVRTGASEMFVPAPLADVWAFLADPARIPEWDTALATIETAAVRMPANGDTWEGRSRTEREYDRKALKVNADALRQQVELTALVHESTIAWRFTYPDAAHANARRIRFDLSPAAGGTQLRIVFRWERDPGRRRRVHGFVFRPLHRFVIWMQLSQIGAGISRAFR